MQTDVSIPQWCDCCLTGDNSAANAIWFQSHNGAIAAGKNGQNWQTFSLVSIPQWCDCCHEVCVGATGGKEGFNPTMVRLLRSKHCDRKHSHLCFNPTMVRLLLACFAMNCEAGNSFQSHNGAIAATTSPSMSLKTSTFQSHNGAIAA